MKHLIITGSQNAYEIIKEYDFNESVIEEVCKLLSDSEERELRFYLKDEK
jgi:hypothetical protein